MARDAHRAGLLEERVHGDDGRGLLRRPQSERLRRARRLPLRQHADATLAQRERAVRAELRRPLGAAEVHPAAAAVDRQVSFVRKLKGRRVRKVDPPAAEPAVNRDGCTRPLRVARLQDRGPSPRRAFSAAMHMVTPIEAGARAFWKQLCARLQGGCTPTWLAVYPTVRVSGNV